MPTLEESFDYTRTGRRTGMHSTRLRGALIITFALSSPRGEKNPRGIILKPNSDFQCNVASLEEF